jgi:hypothetical protein
MGFTRDYIYLLVQGGLETTLRRKRRWNRWLLSSKVPYTKIDRKKEKKTISILLLKKKSQCIRLNTRGCDISAMLMKISSAGWRYRGARKRFWSRWWPMKPMLRPRTNSPFRVPILMYSSASSGVNAPLSRRRSTKQTAMHPSTLRISYIKTLKSWSDDGR